MLFQGQVFQGQVIQGQVIQVIQGQVIQVIHWPPLGAPVHGVVSGSVVHLAPIGSTEQLLKAGPLYTVPASPYATARAPSASRRPTVCLGLGWIPPCPKKKHPIPTVKSALPRSTKRARRQYQTQRRQQHTQRPEETLKNNKKRKKRTGK